MLSVTGALRVSLDGFSTFAVSADDRGSIFFFSWMSCDFRGLLLEGVGRESGGNDGGGLCGPPGSSVCEFSRQEYWSGLPFPTSGDLPDLGIEPLSPELEIIYHCVT